MLMCS